MKTLWIASAMLALAACSSSAPKRLPPQPDSGQIQQDSTVIPGWEAGITDAWVQPDRGLEQDRGTTKRDTTIVTPFDGRPPVDTKISRRDSSIKPTDFGGGPLTTLKAPFTLDFEANNGKLVGTRDWQWGALAFKASKICSSSNKPPKAGHSGSKVWGTILNDCHNPLDNARDTCNNKNPGDDSVLKFNATIPSTFTKATLSFWEWVDYFLNFDWAEIRVDGKVVRQFCKGSRATIPSWKKQTIDLTPYIGKTIFVSFHFLATGVVNYSGWYIDDLAISQ